MHKSTCYIQLHILTNGFERVLNRWANEEVDIGGLL